MRKTNGQFAKGTSGNPNGRPSRADEQFLIDLWNNTGKEQFSDAIKRGEVWALKKLLDKLYPNKKPDNDSGVISLPIPILNLNE